MLRVLVLEGTPWERGLAHGESLRDEIRLGLERWRAVVAAGGIDPTSRVEALAGGSPYAATVASRCPELLEEVRGVAVGAAITSAEALLLNLMDEEWWFREGEEAGCSVLAGPRADGTPMLAQNMDLPIWMDGLQTVLRIRNPGEGAETERVVLSAAGMIGLVGMRRGGVAIGVNTLLQLPRSTYGLPVAFALRSALERADAESAAGYLAALPHASGQHYAVVDARTILGIECSAVGTSLRRFDGDGWLAHTNHPLWSDPTVVSPPDSVGITWLSLDSSVRRLAALQSFTSAPSAAGPVSRVLADTDTGVCMVGSPDYPTATFGSVELSPGADDVRVLSGRPDRAWWIDLTAQKAV